MATDPLEILNRRNAEVAQIRGYQDLTEKAKARRIAEVTERAQQEYRQAVADQEQEIRKRVEKAEKAVFATPCPYGASDAQKAQIRAARRASLQRRVLRHRLLRGSGLHRRGARAAPGEGRADAGPGAGSGGLPRRHGEGSPEGGG